MSDPRDHDQAEDSEDEEDFNPAPADLSDDEGQNDNEDEDETPRRKSRQVSPARHADEDEDEEDDNNAGAADDDEDDEEEDEEDEIQDHRRKRRRQKTNAFFDIEAEVDDEDEGEDDEEDAEDQRDFIENEDVAEVELRDRDDRRHRELDRRRELAAGLNAEEEAQRFQQKYGKKRSSRAVGDTSVVPQRLLLPSVDDPSIWGVRCKEGKEREIVFNIMKKIEERMGTRDELGITAAFERGGPNSVMKGLIYVEARRQTDILQALDGMLNVYPRTARDGRGTILVDIKEMPDLLRVKKTPTLVPGSWVRLRRPPKHSGDLAQVLDVTENGLEARVKFLPRLDYGVRDESARDLTTTDGKRKRPVVGPRPPQKLFSEVEARKRHPRNLSGNPQKNAWQYNGDEFENGFQIKDIKIQLLQVTDVNPTLEEVTKFASGGEDGVENIDLRSLADSLKGSTANITYLPGDVVEVYEGEQKGVVGKATNVQGDIVTMDVTEGDLAGQTIEVPIKGLRKQFRTGDHVRVIGGRYRDEVGMVIKISEDRVTLLTDQTTTEITVFSKDLREASDIGGQGSLGQYEMLDLVQLDPTTVGCIVKIDRESMVVLDQNGDTRQVIPSQIANKLPRRKLAVAADRTGSEIRPDDVVKEYGGMGRQGKIIHIHRTYVFCHSNATNENAGIFVCKVSNVSTISAKGGRINASPAGPDLNAMNPMKKLNANGDKNAMPPPKQTFGRDRLIGQTVTIRKGGWKGLLGRVKETTDTHARVELHTKSKIVNVKKTDLLVRDSVSGQTIKNFENRRGGGFGAGRPGDRPSIPDWNGGSRTPIANSSSRTPAWKTPSAAAGGGRTPAWNRSGDGGRTPAWAGADGSRTVNPYDGSRTAYGGGGGRTPAWSSGAGAKTPAPGDAFGHGSKTPAYGGSGSADPWGSGSKTPYGAAPTPGASGGDGWGYTPGASGDAPTPGAGLLGAPTPGALNAPTPAPYNAPTPGAMNAPTPGGSGWNNGWGADTAPTPAAGAPTPAASGGFNYAVNAPTPGGWGAETAPTPAASGGVRYDEDD